MKVVCLVDNAVQPGSSFWGEHGLAFWIETETGGVLFDTGQSGTVLLHNMDVAGISVADLRSLALSHGHYDHGGGLSSLLDRLESEIPAYANPDFFRPRYSRRPEGVKYIGPGLTEAEIRARFDVRLSSEPQEVAPGVWTTGEVNARPEPEGRGAHHLVRSEVGWVADPYQDDMSLVIETPAGVIVLCGCCHAGLLNTVYHVERTFQRPIVGIAGGTHLASADIAYLRHVGAVLQALPSLHWVAPNHCSGHVAFCELRRLLGQDVVRPCPVGTVIDWEESR